MNSANTSRTGNSTAISRLFKRFKKEHIMTERYFKTLSPRDQQVLLERPYSTPSEVTTKIKAALACQKQWKQTSMKARAEVCERMVAAIEAQQDSIAEEISQQMGRPIAFSGGEINGFAQRARHMIAIAESSLTAIHIEEEQGVERFIQREPLGIAAIISPWNYPYLTAVNTLVPAIMAGNTVLLKPSSRAPLIAERLAEAFKEAGAPQGLFDYLYLNHADTQKLTQNHHIDFIAFTGSVNGGIAMNTTKRKHFPELCLELGGKDAAYVRADANVQLCAIQLADGAFFNSGQSCCGVKRIYVDEKVYGEFVKYLCEETRKLELGDPLNPDTSLGPVISIDAAEKIRQQCEYALNQGACNLIDSAQFPYDRPGSCYIAPRILVEVNHRMAIMKEECFGPVVGVMPVKGDDEAVNLVNDCRYGLTASIWTRDLDAARQLSQALEAGTIFTNRCDYLDPALAWTGVKNTGKGCSLSQLAYERLTRPKSFYLRNTQ